MPSYAPKYLTKARKDPLGPITLNQAQQNVRITEGLLLNEHFSDGQHNALEVPWVLGRVTSGTTGYLFDTTYGGSTITRPATGEATVNVATGVIGDGPSIGGSTVPAAGIIANVDDSDIANMPHLITAEVVSATSIKTRVRRMTSTLGSPGNTWESVARAFSVAVHAQKQPVDASPLSSYALKVRRDFLTQAATDWNALVQNQGTVRKQLMLEHASDGTHNVNRIAKAAGWFRPTTGPSFTATRSVGVDAVSRISEGVVEVTLSNTLASANVGACFPQAQPTDDDSELVIINGRQTGTKTFRFYLYRYSVAEGQWTRADRPFFSPFFGTLA